MEDILSWFVDEVGYWVWDFGIPVQGETIPLVVMLLLGTGFYLTLRFGFIQIRRLGHGFAVTSGRYDDPDEPGDVSHFQALTTALSATVGIGNIAGVAIALHFGGPGALFWMWMTAFLGMATKYTEVTLAQKYRDVGPDLDAHKWEGSVSGGPMYYIERGLGPQWKWMAVLFAALLGITAFLTGNGIQANTVADTMQTEFGIPAWITGLVTASVVAAVILGGIKRIGRVTGVLAPVMAAIYVLGALFIIIANLGAIPGTFALIFREAFNPSAGVAGTGVGAFLVTLMWGVRRGLFSNEAGQGSAPIAHSAAKTDEPVSEGVVALLEPFIDTIVICTMTGLVIIMTGAYNARVPTQLTIGGGDLSWVTVDETGRGRTAATRPPSIRYSDGLPVGTGPQDVVLAWHEVAVERLYTDPALTRPFTGELSPATGIARGDDQQEYRSLFGEAVESGAPLTMLGFQRGLPGEFGQFIVIISVLLFAISTAIAWSYYGDRCANYLFGRKAILPYKMVFVLIHFIGALLPLTVIWDLGDVFLGIVIIPNLIALIILSPQVSEMTRSYFERKPWRSNEEAHRRYVEDRRAGRRK
ncbi:MAG TPA: sodium:alanine symporter family protein [Longimicrobiales bacterium]|nr:sodium:alanine symporter family protein [Longimicrobiales bacterium]